MSPSSAARRTKSTTTRSGRDSRDLDVCSCQKRPRRRRRLSVCVCSPPQPLPTYRMLVSRTVIPNLAAAARSSFPTRWENKLRPCRRPSPSSAHISATFCYLSPSNQRSDSLVAHSLPPSSVRLLFYCSVSVTQSCVRKLVI